MINGKDFVKYINYYFKKIGNKQLQKIAYLTELEYMIRHGERLSDLEYYKYYYGPYSFDISEIKEEVEIDELQDDNAIYIDSLLKNELDDIFKNFKGRTGYELELMADTTEPFIDADYIREKLDLAGYAEYYKALLSDKVWDDVNRIDEENKKNGVYGKVIIKDKSELKSIFS